MPEYSRARVRAFFASMTKDSRPLSTGICPLMLAYRLPAMKAATTLDPELVQAIDRYHKARFGKSALPWAQLSAGEVVEIIDGLRA
jgi:hypothetical protein